MTLLLLDRDAVLTSCSSTQPLCISLAQAGAPEGTVVWSWEQSEGQGRGDHAWISPPNAGFWISFLLRPIVSLELWPAFTALVAGAAAEAIESLEGAGSTIADRDGTPSESNTPVEGLPTETIVQIKWPNDLVGKRGKLGGVLAQSVNGGVVFGLGINVWQRESDFPATLRGRASSLISEGWLPEVGARDAGKRKVITWNVDERRVRAEDVDRRQVTTKDIDERRAMIVHLAKRFDALLEAAYRRFQEGDRDFLREMLRARFYLRDAEVEIVDGRTLHRGRAVDMGPAGELILQSGAARVPVRSGTVLRHGRVSSSS